MSLSHVFVTPSVIHLSLLFMGSDFRYISSICFRKRFGVSYRKKHKECRNYVNKWPRKANMGLFGVGLFACFSPAREQESPSFMHRRLKSRIWGAGATKTYILSTTLQQALPDDRSQEMCESYGLHLVCCLELKHHKLFAPLPISPIAHVIFPSLITLPRAMLKICLLHVW